MGAPRHARPATKAPTATRSRSPPYQSVSARDVTLSSWQLNSTAIHRGWTALRACARTAPVRPSARPRLLLALAAPALIRRRRRVMWRRGCARMSQWAWQAWGRCKGKAQPLVQRWKRGWPQRKRRCRRRMWQACSPLLLLLRSRASNWTLPQQPPQQPWPQQLLQPQAWAQSRYRSKLLLRSSSSSRRWLPRRLPPPSRRCSRPRWRLQLQRPLLLQPWASMVATRACSHHSRSQQQRRPPLYLLHLELQPAWHSTMLPPAVALQQPACLPQWWLLCQHRS